MAGLGDIDSRGQAENYPDRRIENKIKWTFAKRKNKKKSQNFAALRAGGGIIKLKGMTGVLSLVPM